MKSDKSGKLNKLRSLNRRTSGRVEEDDWLITYSDLVTLLLTFFIVIAAISKIDPMRFERVAQSLSGAVGVKTQKEPVDLQSVFELITKLVSEEQLESEVEVNMTEIGVAVSFKGSVLFASGNATIRERAFPVLRKLARAIIDLPYTVSVEGHTDDIPISSEEFPSNWELSTARASHVVRFMINQGVQPAKLFASGYADTKPKAPNRNPDGTANTYNQSLNRRVEIIFLAI